MAFDRWDVALAALPFSEPDRSKFRPVLVLSSASFDAEQEVAIVAMITTAPAGRWSSDQEVVELAPAGLRQTGVVRLKIATLAYPLLDRRIGALSEADRDRMPQVLPTILPIAPKA